MEVNLSMQTVHTIIKSLNGSLDVVRKELEKDLSQTDLDIFIEQELDLEDALAIFNEVLELYSCDRF